MSSKLDQLMRRFESPILRLAVVGIGLALMYLSLSILVNAGWAEGANQLNASKHAAQYASHARNRAQRECTKALPAKKQDCAQDIYDQAREHQRREYEVEAERNSALWDEAMGKATIYGGILGFLTVAILVYGFFLQAQANEQARMAFLHARKEAADAAESTGKSIRAANRIAAASSKQVKIAEEAAYRQLRAYISIERIEVDPIDARHMLGSLIIRNAGRTPARLRFYVNQWIGEIGGHAPEGAPEPYEFTQHNPFINANSPEEIKWFYPLHVEGGAPDEITKLIAPKAKDAPHLAFILYGRIEFTDYARRRRVLHFSYRNNGPVRIGHSFEFIATPWGNEYKDGGEEA